LNPELREIIRREYRNGMSQRAIGRKYHIPRSTVGDHVRDAREKYFRIVKGPQKGAIGRPIRYSDYVTAETGTHGYPSLRYVLFPGLGWILEKWVRRCVG